MNFLRPQIKSFLIFAVSEIGLTINMGLLLFTFVVRIESRGNFIIVPTETGLFGNFSCNAFLFSSLRISVTT